MQNIQYYLDFQQNLNMSTKFSEEHGLPTQWKISKLIVHCLPPRQRGSQWQARDYNVLWRRRQKNITSSRHIQREKHSLNLTIDNTLVQNCNELYTDCGLSIGEDEVKFFCQYNTENAFALRHNYFLPITRWASENNGFWNDSQNRIVFRKIIT